MSPQVAECHLRYSGLLRFSCAMELGLTRSRWTRTGRLPFIALLATAFGLPLALAVHAIFSGREMREMRSVYLRDRAATIAARLEALPADRIARGDFDEIFEGEPALVGLRSYPPEAIADGSPALDAVRSGRELYRTEEIRTENGPVFRAYIPFHSNGGVHVARIDLSSAAPDLILIHARHNTVVAIVSGSVLLLVSLFALWSMRRASSLERQRLETDRLAELGTLSAVLAHEIRNPLGTIKGFAQLAREGAGDSRARPLDAIIRESRRLESLVEALLLYGRPVKPTVAPAEWQPLADELEANGRELIGSRPIRFVIESEIRTLETDANMLKQALLNLIRNSIEAIPPGAGGTVRVSARSTEGGAIKIAVEDDGPGIPDSIRAQLFSPFVTGKASGAGLGLSITNKLIGALGGKLALLSVEPHGTRAEMEFYGTHSDRGGRRRLSRPSGDDSDQRRAPGRFGGERRRRHPAGVRAPVRSGADGSAAAGRDRTRHAALVFRTDAGDSGYHAHGLRRGRDRGGGYEDGGRGLSREAAQ